MKYYAKHDTPFESKDGAYLMSKEGAEWSMAYLDDYPEIRHVKIGACQAYDAFVAAGHWTEVFFPPKEGEAPPKQVENKKSKTPKTFSTSQQPLKKILDF